MNDVRKHLESQIVRNNLDLSSKIKRCARTFFEERQFLEIDTPILMPRTGEKYNTTFDVMIDGIPAMLADSPQIYKMFLTLAGYERYYQIAHCFRSVKGEKNLHTRLCEFVQIDMEMADTSLTELMDIAKLLLVEICALYNKKVTFLTFEGIECRDKYGKDMTPNIKCDEENIYVIFIQHMPLTMDNIVPCHHIFAKPSQNNILNEKISMQGMTTESFDIIINGIEVGGGDMRINDIEEQKKLMKKFNVDYNRYEQYLKNLLEKPDGHRGGFAIGLERLQMALFNENDIHKTTAFPDFYKIQKC